MGDKTLIRRVLLAIYLAVVGVGASADETVELYRADTLVKSQSPAQRAAAAKRGLEQTLVRVSGNPEALDRPAVREALANAEDYVYEYSYASTDETLEDISGEPVPASRLELKFSSVLIERLLRAADLAFWPANRPSVLIWVVKNDVSGPQTVTGDELWQALREAADNRGLPVTTPLFDLEDHLAMSADALWQLDNSTIREASERYRGDAILVLRYSETSSGEVRGDWQLTHSEGERLFDGEADSVAGIARRAVDSVANYLASLYAIRLSTKGDASIVMRLEGVETFGQFKAVQSYLGSLALVRRAQLETLTQKTLTMRLHTEGDAARLEDTLALDERLVPASTSISLPDNRFQVRGTAVSPLHYRLAPGVSDE